MIIFTRLMFIFLFGASFLGKINDLERFREGIAAFRLVPQSQVKSLAYVILFSEFSVVLLLTLGQVFLIPGFLLTTLLLTVFSLALFSALWRGVKTPCYCFGNTTRNASVADLIRNLLFVIFAFSGLVLSWTEEASSPMWMEVFLSALAAAASVLLLSHLGDLLEALGFDSNSRLKMSRHMSRR